MSSSRQLSGDIAFIMLQTMLVGPPGTKLRLELKAGLYRCTVFHGNVRVMGSGHDLQNAVQECSRGLGDVLGSGQ